MVGLKRSEVLDRGFYAIPKEVMDHQDLTLPAKVCYGVIFHYLWGQADKVWPTLSQMAQTMSCSSDSIRGYIRQLEHAGFIEMKTVRSSKGTRNEYCFIFPDSTSQEDTPPGTDTPPPLEPNTSPNKENKPTQQHLRCSPAVPTDAIPELANLHTQGELDEQRPNIRTQDVQAAVGTIPATAGVRAKYAAFLRKHPDQYNSNDIETLWYIEWAKSFPGVRCEPLRSLGGSPTTDFRILTTWIKKLGAKTTADLVVFCLSNWMYLRAYYKFAPEYPTVPYISVVSRTLMPHVISGILPRKVNEHQASQSPNAVATPKGLGADKTGHGGWK